MSDTEFFGGIFDCLRAGKVFPCQNRSQFVAIGPENILQISQQITFLWLKLILDRYFALAKEIIHVQYRRKSEYLSIPEK